MHQCLCRPGVSFGLFVDEMYYYIVLEKASSGAFQALWIEISDPGKKNIFSMIYRQCNSPQEFMSYFDEKIEKFIS